MSFNIEQKWKLKIDKIRNLDEPNMHMAEIKTEHPAPRIGYDHFLILGRSMKKIQNEIHIFEHHGRRRKGQKRFCCIEVQSFKAHLR